MLRKTIKFKDLDGNEVEEDFYFNLSKAEIAELELSYDGGFRAHLLRIVEAQDGAAIIETFKMILRKSVGRRSDDGRRFEKSEEIWKNFYESDAYSVLFMQLVTDAEVSSEFIRSIVPPDLASSLALPATEEDEIPLYVRENRRATQEEFKRMSPQEQMAAFAFQPKP